MAKTACKKCDPHEICEECPEWIFTLADLIMCMMGLFVILWVLKPGAQTKPGQEASEELTKMLAEIREAFGHVPDPDTKDPVDLQILMNKISRLKLNGPGEKGKARQDSKGAEGTDPEVTSIRMGKESTVGGRLLFEKNNAQLSRSVMTDLDSVISEIRGHRQIVMIKGHTSLDDLPENATAEQKMDLSLRRAQAVSDYLTTHAVSPDVIRVQGCSTFEPVQQRAYTPDMQALNRRVEVEATTTLVEQLQDNKPKGASSVPVTPAEPKQEQSVMDTTLLMLSLLFGIVGMGMFMYGKKAGRMVPLGAGVALMVVPYFISSAMVLFLVCCGLMAMPWIWRDS